jgi:quercetin dioxygenase-like cupin family protein
METVRKVWGEEYIIVNKEYCGKILTLKQQHRCSIHHHKNKNETFLVLEGLVLIEKNGELFVLHPFQSIDILAGENHRFTGLTGSRMIEFSSHHEDDDSYRTSSSERVPDCDFHPLYSKYVKGGD